MTQLHAKGFFSLCTSQSVDRTAKLRFAMLFFAFFLKSTFFSDCLSNKYEARREPEVLQNHWISALVCM